MSVTRINSLRKTLKKENLDAMIVSHLDHIRYLTGFSGSSGLLLVDKARAHFMTDFRYADQAAQEVRGAKVTIVPAPFSKALAKILSIRRKRALIGYEQDHLSVSAGREFASALNGSGPILTPTCGIIETLASVKDPGEIAAIRTAARIADEAFAEVLPLLRPGLREIEIAAELEYQMKLRGASKAAFDIIVASGYRSAMPHGIASTKKLAKGDFVTCDFGAMFNGYVSDITRTIVIGKATARQRRIYDIVLKSQKAGVRAVRHNRKAVDVDRASRRIIEKAGFGKNFGHSTGHGIGVYVHTPPKVGPNSTDILLKGMVITVEPGIYIPRWGGVRIEDDVLVGASGGEVLNKTSKKLLEL